MRGLPGREKERGQKPQDVGDLRRSLEKAEFGKNLEVQVQHALHILRMGGGALRAIRRANLVLASGFRISPPNIEEHQANTSNKCSQMLLDIPGRFYSKNQSKSFPKVAKKEAQTFENEVPNFFQTFKIDEKIEFPKSHEKVAKKNNF